MSPSRIGDLIAGNHGLARTAIDSIALFDIPLLAIVIDHNFEGTLILAQLSTWLGISIRHSRYSENVPVGKNAPVRNHVYVEKSTGPGLNATPIRTFVGFAFVLFPLDTPSSPHSSRKPVAPRRGRATVTSGTSRPRAITNRVVVSSRS